MSEAKTLGWWFGENGWMQGVCEHNNVVHAIYPKQLAEPQPWFIPAPLDLHVHGGGGADVMQGDEAIRTVLKTHAKHGTAALLATSVTAPFEAIDDFLDSVQRVMKNPPSEGAHLLGVHLEGPFINPDKLGAQPDFPAAIDLEKLESWLRTGLVKAITYAPELDEGHQLLTLCKHYGARVQVGHTLCNWAQACQALKMGAGVTHLYNAMSPVKHRGGGAAVAALAYAEYAEVITDGVHVDRAAFDAARRAIPGLYSVTDATAAAGMPDGQYQLGSLCIEKVGDRVVLPDGTLAGSCLTQQRSLQVLRQWDLEWSDIARLCSATPARWLELKQFGTISVGAWANWLEVDQHGVVALWLNGQRQSLE